MGYNDSGNDAYDGREKRALQYLVSLGERDKAGKLELPKCEPGYRWAFWNPVKGELELHDATPGPVGFVAANLDAFRDILLDARKREGGEESRIRVFVGTAGATAVLNVAGDRRDQVLCPFAETPAWREMKQMANGEWSQTELILALRTDLAGCDRSGLLALLRLMKFESGQRSESQVSAGLQSLSADAQRKALMGGQVPPDTVEFELSLYDRPPGMKTHVIRCALDVEPVKKQIVLIPQAGELERAQQATTAEICTFLQNGLREAGIPVWCGEPG